MHKRPSAWHTSAAHFDEKRQRYTFKRASYLVRFLVKSVEFSDGVIKGLSRRLSYRDANGNV